MFSSFFVSAKRKNNKLNLRKFIRIRNTFKPASFKKFYKIQRAAFLLYFNWKVYFRLFFNSFIRNGLKKTLLCLFNKLLNTIKINSTCSVKIYLSQVFFNLKPVLISKFLYKSKYLRIPIPWHYFSRFWKLKYATLAISWLKKSISERSEKTLILKIFSEFESIRLNKGRTIEKKKNFIFH